MGLFNEAGFHRIEANTLGIGDLHFLLAEAPNPSAATNDSAS